mmetsp:Transcript_8008/g.18566  ORF Transcript_8008/g.18566 Transcript_8008/m.18566 type:complete len:310 (+) Transcript_8008:498-1427(+)
MWEFWCLVAMVLLERPLEVHTFAHPNPKSPPLVWSQSTRDESIAARLERLALAKGGLKDARTIVFDKDGTLGEDAASLKRWAIYMTQQLEVELKDLDTREGLMKEFHAHLGWDPQTQALLPSAPLAAGTWQDQVVTTQTILQKANLDPDLAVAWHAEMERMGIHGADPPVLKDGGLRAMMEACRDDHGLLVSVCTSDDTIPTREALALWGVDDVVRCSVCADQVSEPKPSAVPLRTLCRHLEVEPHQCIVVGDTVSDTGMARNANALLCIGVLTGSGTASQLLETGADVVVPDVGHVPALLSRLRAGSS